MIRMVSVCSGIGGAELAFAGMARHVFASETDLFARAVLAHRFPDLTVHHDFTDIASHDSAVDVLVGGTPCQSFSVAGLRGGMADKRGNLALEFLRLADRLKPQYILWENVPGVLSVNDGKDFICFLDGLESIGYVVDVDILDAQFFGLAQRRRRVFVCAERAEYILTARTLSSGLTIAQCLMETLLLTLAVLSNQSVPECGNSVFDASEPVISLQRRMRLFGLDQAEQASILAESLAALLRSYECAQDVSVSHHGSVTEVASKTSVGTRLNESVVGMEPWRVECRSTERSWDVTLAEALRIAKECTTSIVTNGTTESRIYTCARAALHIAAHIDQSMCSSPCFWSAASSASITVKAFTNYARSAVSDLFTDLEWLQPWHDFLSQAERADYTLSCLGDWTYSRDLLPLSASLRGHPAPGREAREGTAGTLAASTGGSDENDAKDGRLIAFGGNDTRGPIDVATARNAHGGPRGVANAEPAIITHSLQADGFDASEDGTGRGTPGNEAGTLIQTSAVRRLTPRECERLQGFPDDWTAIQYRGKPASDGPRYRALGNAFAVPVVRWIAKRLVREHEAMLAESTEIAS